MPALPQNFDPRKSSRRREPTTKPGLEPDPSGSDGRLPEAPASPAAAPSAGAGQEPIATTIRKGTRR
ncbi:hypothetical protein D9Y22_07215 [Methylorubrum sp. DB1722]|nr:hypothetical protein [Methylorubrum sp. DB1722]